MNKTSLLLASLLTAAAFTTQAGELYTPEQYQQPASDVTRAQVGQSVLQARKAGELKHDDVDQPEYEGAVFGRTRTDVKAEVLAAAKTGGLQHNDVDLPSVAQGSALTRQQVRDEYLASRRSARTAPGRSTIDY